MHNRIDFNLHLFSELLSIDQYTQVLMIISAHFPIGNPNRPDEIGGILIDSISNFDLAC